MASSKISQLPVQESSGTTILDELAIVNSGETLTSKITLEAFTMSSGNTIGSTVGFNTGYIYLPIMSFENNVDNFDRFVSVNSDSASSEFNTRQVTDISAKSSFYGNFFQAAIIASERGVARNNGNQSAVIASYADPGQNVGVLGASQSVVLAARNGEINGGQNNALIATQGSSLQSGSLLSAIIAAEACNQIGTRRSFIAAAYDSDINSSWEFNGIMGGRSNDVLNNSERRWIIASENSSIDASNNTVILNGYDVDVTGSTEGRSFISMSAHTADLVDYAWTTHSDNLYSYGQISQGVQNLGSGDTFSIDWSLGGIVELFLTGASTCSMTNVRPGSSYTAYITTTGADTLTPSAAGYTFKFEGGGFTFTSGGTDCCVLDVVGTNIYVRHFADFS